MRLALVSLCFLVLLLPNAFASPKPPLRGAIESWLHPQSDEVAQLRAENRKLRKANNYHARWVRKLQAAIRERVNLGPSGIERGFLCIHRFEGAWNDTGAPYWGGLQMDSSFQSTYAPWFVTAFGPASNWTPAMQLATAMRAYVAGRGYGPWPSTRRMCGV